MFGIFSGVSGAYSYINDALYPVEIPSDCGKWKMISLAQNACVCAIVVSTISALFTAIIMAPPFFMLSLLVLTVSLVGSYNLKQLLIDPMPQIPEIRQKELAKEVNIHFRHYFPQADQDVMIRLQKHVELEFIPENFTEEEKEDLRKDYVEPDPVIISKEERIKIHEKLEKVIEKSKDRQSKLLNLLKHKIKESPESFTSEEMGQLRDRYSR